MKGSVHHGWAITALAGLAMSGSAAAATLVCQYTSGIVKTGCVLQDSEIGGKQDFHADFAVTYTFPCNGHAIGAAFYTDDMHVLAPFTAAGATRTVQLSGTGAVRLGDTDPERTRRASLAGACELQIVALAAQPSFPTLTLWQTEATGQTRIISEVLDKWLLSKRFDQIVNWHTEQLTAARTSLEQQLADLLPDTPFETLVYPLSDPDVERRGRLKAYSEMPESWQTAVLVSPQLPDIVIMLSQVRAILEGRPPVYQPQDTQRYKAQLVAEVTRGSAMIERANKWLALLTAEMKRTKDNLVAIRDRAVGSSP